jgi:DNA polymerase-3 subunit alpha
MAARSAIRAVGRALNYPYASYDILAKMIPVEPGITLKNAIEMVPDLKERYTSHAESRKLLDAAMSLEGLPLHTSTHAAGVLITDHLGVSAHVPMWRTDKGIVAQWHMGNLEELGLLKMDFLGLSTLTVISNTIKWVKRNYNIDIDLEELYKCEDLKPLALMRDGQTDGLFQLEGGGMTQFMTELRPRNMEDVILGISIYRPGPKQYIPKLLYNRRNESQITYYFKELRPILSSTFGILTYQEQCMQAVIAVAGYQKHHSDGFRKAISKKIAYLIEEHRGYFIQGRQPTEKVDAIPGGVAMGHELATLEKFYGEMQEFGKYAFNKSHGAVYAVIAYLTAWLKYYYPTEFMASLMDSVSKDKVRVGRYINHCRKYLDIRISLPDILVSNETFVPESGKRIIYSLSAKGISETNIAEICKNRDVESMYEFFERNYINIDKTTLEALVAIGSFSRLGVVKSKYIAALEDITDALGKVRSAKKRADEPAKPTKSGKPGRKKSFDFRERFDLDSMLPDIIEYPEEQNLKIEKQFLGLYLSGHPLDRYSFSIENFCDFKTSDIDYEIDDDTGEVMILADNIIDSKEIKFIGVLNGMKQIITKKNTLMAHLDVEDLYGTCKVTVFPELYKELSPILKEDEVYQIRGKIQCKPGEIPGVICTYAQKLSQLVVRRMILNITDNLKETLEYLEELKAFGTAPLYITHGGMRVLLPKTQWVDIDLFLRYRDNTIIKDEQILIKEW